MTAAPCPVCGDAGGFHDEEVHAARPVEPSIKALPLPDEQVVLCRACGEPLDGPGAPGCRYPRHAS